jgi:histone-lysine N-methyltransferase SETMAR
MKVASLLRCFSWFPWKPLLFVFRKKEKQNKKFSFFEKNKEMEPIFFRAMMAYDFKRGISAEECAAQLHQAWGNEAPHLRTVERWFERFLANDFDLHDQPRSGRPISVVTKENIDAVAKLIKDDPRITYEEIAEDLQISAPSIHTIIHDHLKLRKVTARWVPHLLKTHEMEERIRISKKMLTMLENGESSKISKILTGDETWLFNFEPLRKEQSRQWIGENDPRPAKVVKSRYSAKQMVAVLGLGF